MAVRPCIVTNDLKTGLRLRLRFLETGVADARRAPSAYDWGKDPVVNRCAFAILFAAFLRSAYAL